MQHYVVDLRNRLTLDAVKFSRAARIPAALQTSTAGAAPAKVVA